MEQTITLTFGEGTDELTRMCALMGTQKFWTTINGMDAVIEHVSIDGVHLRTTSEQQFIDSLPPNEAAKYIEQFPPVVVAFDDLDTIFIY